ncbi:hypothetical protein NE686_01300 [Tissierella carlieri]|uniref:N-acetyltransferase domain-containing protein n=1 Tax=Tissierella carlieri TaxID=689904 RepID=A0ABT1S6N5_9FIRM|nr:hypothetical protein [Tissierella carlieri]MCQ4921707.1 hypothetical protein [Tissierella carlieri]
MRNMEEFDLVILRDIQEFDLDFIVDSERESVIVEEKTANQPVGYVTIEGITNPSQNIKFKRIVISNKGKGLEEKH